MRAANQLVGKTLGELAKHIAPGVNTLQLDKIAEEFIRDNGATPTFKGFPNQYGDPFPASICTSVNEQVVHGIPGDIVLKDGDIVSVDCGTYMNNHTGAILFCAAYRYSHFQPRKKGDVYVVIPRVIIPMLRG